MKNTDLLMKCKTVLSYWFCICTFISDGENEHRPHGRRFAASVSVVDRLLHLPLA